VLVRDDAIHQHLLHPAMIVAGSGRQAGWFMVLDPNELNPLGSW